MRVPLRAKFFVLAALLALVPLGLVGMDLVRITRDELKSAANEELTGVAASLAAEIDSTFRGRYLAPLMVIRNGADSPALDVKQKIALLNEGMSGVPDLKALQLTVAGANLPVLITDQAFSATLADAGLDPASTLRIPVNEVQLMAREQRFGIPEISLIPETGTWLATVALPLEQPIAGRPVVLAAKFDLGHLADLRDGHPFSSRGEITLVGAEGRRLLGRGPGDLVTDREIAAAAVSLLGQAARPVALQAYTRPDGTPMLGAYAFTATVPWAVVAELREASAYAVVDQMTRSMLTFATFGLAAALVGAVVLAQRLTGPILRIGAAAERVGQGDFTTRVPVGTMKDEISDLASRFNGMIAALAERIELMKFVSRGTVDAVRRAAENGVERGGARREVAVLFTDIRGYTRFTQSVAPETVVEMLNRYLDSQSEIVKAHGGDIDKFIGDSLVAVFEGPGREMRAVTSAIEIQADMSRLLAEGGDHQLRIGIGIASGEVVMGAIGARDRMDFTVLGSTVNLAARLCSAAPPDQVLADIAVRDAVETRWPGARFAALEPLHLKGYAEPVPAFAVTAAAATEAAE